jgi:EmrB/QacA subfamily drug resistance transporter
MSDPTRPPPSGETRPPNDAAPLLVEEGEVDYAVPRRRLAAPVARVAAVSERASYRWWALGAVLSGLFATGLTITVITAALPFIGRDLDTSRAALSWVVVAPFLFRSVFVPAFGKLGDRYGRKRMWVTGFAVSATASLFCGFAPNIGVLIVMRAIAATASAAVVPSSLALIADAFEPEERVKALGWWSATIAVSPLLGVILGGFVVEALSWRWLFFLQFPFSAVALVFGTLVLRESRGRADEPFDLRGALLSIVGLGSLMLVLNQGTEWGWTSPAILGALVVAVFLLVAFVRNERRVEAPVLPIDYFRRRRFAAAVGANFSANFAYMGGFFVTSLMLADVWDYGPAQVSLAISPRAAALGIMGPIGGYLAARYGGRRMATWGMGFLLASMVTLAALDAGATYWALLPGLVLSGFGLGLVAPPTSATVTNEAAPEDLAAVSGALNMGASVGSSMGIAAMQAVVSIVAGSGTPGMDAYSAAFVFGAVACGLGLVAASQLGAPRAATVAAAAATTR